MFNIANYKRICILFKYGSKYFSLDYFVISLTTHYKIQECNFDVRYLSDHIAIIFNYVFQKLLKVFLALHHFKKILCRPYGKPDNTSYENIKTFINNVNSPHLYEHKNKFYLPHYLRQRSNQ